MIRKRPGAGGHCAEMITHPFTGGHDPMKSPRAKVSPLNERSGMKLDRVDGCIHQFSTPNKSKQTAM